MTKKRCQLFKIRKLENEKAKQLPSGKGTLSGGKDSKMDRVDKRRKEWKVKDWLDKNHHDDSKIQFVIGDDSMVSAALLNPKLDLLLVTDWDDCPDGPNMLFPTVFHKSFMHLPPCMHSFHAYELKQKIWLV